MTMRRRSFLGLFGAAIAAPALPAAAPAVGYSRASYGLAVAHAQKYPLVSIKGLIKRVGLSPTQAEAVFQKMSADGLLGVAYRTRVGTCHATSKICTNEAWRVVGTTGGSTVTTKQPASSKVASDRPAAEVPHRTKAMHLDVKLDDMLAHLHDLCLSCGMPLSPKCMGMAA